ncbi:hypothetical protein BH09ACT4_BH09ACT4_03950 [soil metagenome]
MTATTKTKFRSVVYVGDRNPTIHEPSQPTAFVASFGDEFDVSELWIHWPLIDDHAEQVAQWGSVRFLASELPDAAEAKALRTREEAARRGASYAHALQTARTADERAELRIRERQQLAAEARAAMGATTAGSAA